MWTTTSLMILVVCLRLFLEVEAGCEKSRMCCQGKDNKCHAFETVRGGNVTRCFCDASCLQSKDCCPNYSDYCQPVDCMMDENWQTWSECNTRCGIGVKNRTRRIMLHPKNGGKECGSTRQYRMCEGTQCKMPRTFGASPQIMKEIAHILPLSIAKWRTDVVYNPLRDIRKNLFNTIHQKAPKGPPKIKDTFCTKYKLTEVHRLCSRRESSIGGWTEALLSEREVCVECQPTASRPSLGGRCEGQGVYGRETRWTAMTVTGCNGKWTMLSKPKPCQCQQENFITSEQNNFIFV